MLCPRRSHLLALAFGCLMNLTAGTVFMLGMIGSDFQQLLSWPEQQSTLVQMMGVVGLNLGILGGVIFDHCGGKLTSLVCGAVMSINYLFLFAALMTGYGPPALVGLVFFLIGQACGTMYIMSVATAMHNFPPNARGKVGGLLSACFALGVAFFTSILAGFGKTDLREYYYLYFAIHSLLICLLASVFLVQLNPDDCFEQQQHSEFTVNLEMKDWGSQTAGTGVDGEEVDVHGKDLLKSLNFWLLFITIGIQDGGIAMFVNKIGGLVETSGSPIAKETLAITFALCNALSRICWGGVVDKTQSFMPTSRVLFITILVTSVAHLIVFFVPNNLLMAAILLGIAFGGLFGCGPLLVTQLFGRIHFGTNWGLLLIAPSLGTMLFGQVYNAVYSVEEAHQHSMQQQNITSATAIAVQSCAGSDCYRYAFLCASISCLIALVTCHWLAIRQSKLRRTYRLVSSSENEIDKNSDESEDDIFDEEASRRLLQSDDSLMAPLERAADY